MAKNARNRPGKLQKLRASKSDKINTDLFNFLENLLVFRTLEDLSVPQESSVKFRITREQGDPGICLLIHIDDQCFPVIEPDVPRPDYLAIYLHGDGCICTIIEMKSKAGKNLKHGIEQIKTLAEKLKNEFQEHLPPRFRLHIQGILLSQYNSDVPRELIARMAQQGLTILSAQCNDCAELYSYISQKNSLQTRFDQKRRSPTNPSPVEELLSRNSLRSRIDDPMTKERAGAGLHINYVLSDADEYATLMTRDRKCVFVINEQGNEHAQRLKDDIVANGLEHKFFVETMPNE